MSGITVNLAGNSGAGVSPYAQPPPQQPTSPINPGDGATRQDGDTAAGATPTTDTAAATPSTPTGELGAVIDGALNGGEGQAGQAADQGTDHGGGGGATGGRADAPSANWQPGPGTGEWPTHGNGWGNADHPHGGPPGQMNNNRYQPGAPNNGNVFNNPYPTVADRGWTPQGGYTAPRTNGPFNGPAGGVAGGPLPTTLTPLPQNAYVGPRPGVPNATGLPLAPPATPHAPYAPYAPAAPSAPAAPVVVARPGLQNPGLSLAPVVAAARPQGDALAPLGPRAPAAIEAVPARAAAPGATGPNAPHGPMAQAAATAASRAEAAALLAGQKAPASNAAAPGVVAAATALAGSGVTARGAADGLLQAGQTLARTGAAPGAANAAGSSTPQSLAAATTAPGAAQESAAKARLGGAMAGGVTTGPASATTTAAAAGANGGRESSAAAGAPADAPERVLPGLVPGGPRRTKAAGPRRPPPMGRSGSRLERVEAVERFMQRRRDDALPEDEEDDEIFAADDRPEPPVEAAAVPDEAALAADTYVRWAAWLRASGQQTALRELAQQRRVLVLAPCDAAGDHWGAHLLCPDAPGAVPTRAPGMSGQAWGLRADGRWPTEPTQAPAPPGDWRRWRMRQHLRPDGVWQLDASDTDRRLPAWCVDGPQPELPAPTRGDLPLQLTEPRRLRRLLGAQWTLMVLRAPAPPRAARA